MKIQAGNLLLGTFLGMFLFILIGILPKFLSSFIGMAYPAYMTMHIS